jgi:hypothetical protein
MATFGDSSAVVVVSSAASPDTDGAWVQLFNPTSKNYKWMMVSVFNLNGSDALFDIGIGESGSQVEIIQDQFVKWIATSGTAPSNTVFSFPLPVDSGTKVWMRIKDTSGSALDYSCVMTLSTLPLSSVIPTSAESFENHDGSIFSAASVGGFGPWWTMFNSLAVDRTWLSLVLFSVNTGALLETRFDVGSGPPTIVVDFGELHYQQRHESSSQRTGVVYNFPVSWPSGTAVHVRVKDFSASSIPYWVGATIF